MHQGIAWMDTKGLGTMWAGSDTAFQTNCACYRQINSTSCNILEPPTPPRKLFGGRHLTLHPRKVRCWPKTAKSKELASGHRIIKVGKGLQDHLSNCPPTITVTHYTMSP